MLQRTFPLLQVPVQALRERACAMWDQQAASEEGDILQAAQTHHKVQQENVRV